jgi:hypothetical protein
MNEQNSADVPGGPRAPCPRNPNEFLVEAFSRCMTFCEVNYERAAIHAAEPDRSS